HAHLAAVHVWLVVENLLLGRLVVGDGAQCDMGDGAVAESAGNALLRPGQFIVLEDGRHEALLGQSDSYARRVAGDPATSPLFGDVGRGATAAGGVENQVTRVGSHENAAFDHLGVGF